MKIKYDSNLRISVSNRLIDMVMAKLFYRIKKWISEEDLDVIPDFRQVDERLSDEGDAATVGVEGTINNPKKNI